MLGRTATRADSLYGVVDLDEKSYPVVAIPRRVLYLIGDCDEKFAAKAIPVLESLDSEDGDIRIVLNCNGGSETDGYAIYDAITMCRNHVTIDGYGSVYSIAAAIFQAGDRRRLAPNAQFMIHNGTIPHDKEDLEQNRVLDMAEQIRKDNERYYQILSHSSQQPMEIIEEFCRAETFFSAQEAYEAGFADEVMEPQKSKAARKKKRKR